MMQDYEKRIERALRLYWAHHKSFTQIADMTGLSWQTVHDAVIDSILNNEGFRYRKKEER